MLDEHVYEVGGDGGIQRSDFAHLFSEDDLDLLEAQGLFEPHSNETEAFMGDGEGEPGFFDHIDVTELEALPEFDADADTIVIDENGTETDLMQVSGYYWSPDGAAFFQHDNYRGRVYVGTQSQKFDYFNPLRNIFSSIYFGSRVLAVQVFERDNYKGHGLVITGSRPRLSAYKYNDKIKGYRVFHRMPKGCVRLGYHINFGGGIGSTACKSTYKFGRSNDKTSSVMLGPRTSVRLCKNWYFGGTKKRWQNNSYSRNLLIEWVGSTFNDIFSSMYVGIVCPPWDPRCRQPGYQ